MPSLNQKFGGPCPYYTLYNIFCLHQRQEDQILNRERFDGYHDQWAQIIANNIESTKERVKFSSRMNTQIEDLIAHDVKELSEENSFAENIAMYYSAPRDNIYPQQNLLFGYGLLPWQANILRFRYAGQAQYVYVFTEHATNQEVEGISFSWPRTYATGANGHTFAVKIEWTGEPRVSPVRLSVLDSYMGTDCRFVRLVHKIYHDFVHVRLRNEENIARALGVLD